MDSPLLARALMGPALYLALCGLILVAQLLPVGMMAQGWPGPDLILCVTIAWILRQPDLLPFWIIGTVALIADFIAQQPPGVGAALLLVITEILRARAPQGPSLSPLVEMLIFAAIAAAMIALKWLVLTIFVVPQPHLADLFAQWPVTFVCYPVIVLFLTKLCNIRRFGGGDWNRAGSA